MTKMFGPRARRTLVTTLAVAAGFTAQLLTATAANARAYPPDSRGAHTPNVLKPFIGSTGHTDLRTFRAATPTRKGHDGTEFKASCGRAVVATHPGVVEVITTATWAGPSLVKITANAGGLTTMYAYLNSATVTTGQIVASGQQIGTVGDQGRARGCQLRFIVHDNGDRKVNPTDWLRSAVGHPIAGGRLLNHSGFTVVSFNVLGASHTSPGGDRAGAFAPADQRAEGVVAKWDALGADIIGVQEMQRVQRADFYNRMKSRYTFFPFDGGVDTDNSIMWRQATFKFVQGGSFKVPYFNGNLRNMPWALLMEKATGKKVYVINVHNPATLPSRGDQSKWRAAAIAAERALVTKFNATGTPVFLTGDFNDREKAFCPLTADGLLVSSSGGDGAKCVLPFAQHIDYVFGAGRVAFSTWIKDKSTQEEGLSDHPMIITRAHLEN